MQLEQNAQNVLAELQKAKSKVGDASSAEFRRLAADVAIQAGLGKFFAAKFRAGVLHAIYHSSSYPPALEAALKANRAARNTWAEFADAAKGIYRDDVTFGPDYYQRGHWQDRLAAMEDDIADMEKPESAGKKSSKFDAKTIEQAINAVHESAKSANLPSPADFHNPPASFQRGQPLAIAVHTPKVAGVRLRYRRVNQAEEWQTTEMGREREDFSATIPADYTNSPFPLQYYFQIRSDSGQARLHPGLEHRWHGQPYFFLPQGT